jgi:protein-S-isoprenylcysteine O-methyltransferase Ste14
MDTENSRISRKILVWMFIVVSLFSFLPLIVSGRWDWWEGWVYAIIFLGGFILTRGLLARFNPDLVVERVTAGSNKGVKSWDRVLAPLMALGGTVISLAAGLDVRFSLSQPFGLQIQFAALAVIIAAYAFGTWALIENRYFSSMVRIQTDRGHKVISSGPYRWVRHPGYAGTVATYLAIPFFLNSAWAFIPAVLLIIVSVVRTYMEDKVLQEELDGYKDYARQVRYRLVSGIW